MRRYKTGWMDGYYGLPSGHLEEGEAPAAAAIRETAEEIGINLKPEDLKFAVVMHRKAANEADREYIDFFFTAENWPGEPRLMEPDKCDEVGWFPLDNLPEKIIPYVKDAILAAQTGNNYLER